MQLQKDVNLIQKWVKVLEKCAAPKDARVKKHKIQNGGQESCDSLAKFLVQVNLPIWKR